MDVGWVFLGAVICIGIANVAHIFVERPFLSRRVARESADMAALSAVLPDAI